MRRVGATLVAAWACAFAGGAVAADDGACAVAANLVSSDVGLSHVAEGIQKAHRLDIAVMGTGSSILPSASGADLAYPARLQATLSKRLPGVEIKVSSYARMKQTAAEMASGFAKVLTGARPALVIWQTGTVDAMKGIDPDDFRAALEEGVAALQSKGSDVVLMNMQYSPRTESMIAINTYADNMRWVAQNREVPLFDRFAIMKQWSELGTFDLYGATRNAETAAHVHDCIGQLLSDLVLEGAKLAQVQPKAVQ
jgi:hypothetical protein